MTVKIAENVVREYSDFGNRNLEIRHLLSPQFQSMPRQKNEPAHAERIQLARMPHTIQRQESPAQLRPRNPLPLEVHTRNDIFAQQLCRTFILQGSLRPLLSNSRQPLT